MVERSAREPSRPAVPVGGGVPIDPETGERFGYLPRKAARRKIIIRRTLGLPWVFGALAAAALILAAGGWFLLSDPGRPPARYADEGPLAAYPPGQVTPLASGQGWVDRRDGVTVWLTVEPFCESDGGWGAALTRWDARGVAQPLGANLRIADSTLASGALYVDPLRSVVAPGSRSVRLPDCSRPRPAAR